MYQTIRSVRLQSPSIISRSTINLRSVASSSSRPENKQSMDKKSEKTGGAMSSSFGDGYATRSDEEGFGGTVGGSQSSVQMDKEIHENHPAYDKTQGSEVKEKEQARHQTKPSK